MPSFIGLPLKYCYRTGESNVVAEFFVPFLRRAVSYDRAVGYFSSSSLVELSQGLFPFLQNGGKIRVAASPQLDEQDIIQIERGYRLREEVIENRLIESLAPRQEISEGDLNRLNLLCELIAQGRLDIRICLSDKGGIYHEKIGLMRDADENVITFNGSANETASALKTNYESITCLGSWQNSFAKEQAEAESRHFEEVWSGKAAGLKTYTFKNLPEQILRRYRDSSRPITDQDKTDGLVSVVDERPENKRLPGIPDAINLRDYQMQAVERFLQCDGRGIFSMATGTGKTFTALAAISALRARLEGRIFTVIVVPMQSLVEQWVENLRVFGITNVIVADSAHEGWREEFTEQLTWYVAELEESCFVITTIPTFRDSLQKIVNQNKPDNALLVADEAHNFGAPLMIKRLSPTFSYRLALTATFERHHDEAGTKVLRDYFGNVCFEYSLQQAMTPPDAVLTPYDYVPVVVSMNKDEREAYRLLTKQYVQANATAEKNPSDETQFKAHMKLVERSNLIACVDQKIPKFFELLKELRSKGELEERGILVYCGKSAALPSCSDILPPDTNDELKDVDRIVTGMNAMNIRTYKFTSELASSVREDLLRDMRNDRIQALVAIKCLDEGVDIPNVRTAFILASTTNPKEYIQRRGRVLRRAEGKEKAVIYDFVVLPYSPEEAPGVEREVMNTFTGLINNEIERMKEFSSSSLPESRVRAEQMISNIIQVYK